MHGPEVKSKIIIVCRGAAAFMGGWLHAGAVRQVPNVPDQAFQQRGRRSCSSASWVPSVPSAMLVVLQMLLLLAVHGRFLRMRAAG